LIEASQEKRMIIECAFTRLRVTESKPKSQ